MADDASSAEAQRVRETYARRAKLGLDARYDYWEPANLFIYQSRERVLLELLRQANLLPLSSGGILDVGCGDGSVLRDLLRYGADETALHGIDLLPGRVERARSALPNADIRLADAQILPYEDGVFDLVLAFTLLSSVISDEARQRICADMRRVTKPGGLVILYDFWVNPFNRDARPLRRDQVLALFPSSEVTFKSATLAPPITRGLMRIPGGRLACTVLEVIPFLRTHFLAAVSVAGSS
jgi:SAM-dependent methyltransferase